MLINLQNNERKKELLLNLIKCNICIINSKKGKNKYNITRKNNFQLLVSVKYLICTGEWGKMVNVSYTFFRKNICSNSSFFRCGKTEPENIKIYKDLLKLFSK